MIARFFASVLAALALFGSLPLWWWLHHKLAVPAEAAVAPATETTPASTEPADAGAVTSPVPADAEVTTMAVTELSEAQAVPPAPDEPAIQTAAESLTVADESPAPSIAEGESVTVAESTPTPVPDIGETAPPSE